jgi:hypothetical protein
MLMYKATFYRFGEAEEGPHFHIIHEILANEFYRHTTAKVEAVGSLNRSFEWHITFQHEADCLKLLKESPTIVIDGPEGAFRTGTLRPLVDRYVKTQILWCPSWVPELDLWHNNLA